MGFLLFVHVFGAVLFLGNIITAAFWKVRADRTNHPEIIHNTAKTVMLADLVFTIPGLLLIVISGHVMMYRAGYLISPLNWLSLSLLLLALTGIIWLAVLLPLQRRMVRLSAQAVESGIVPSAYHRVSWYWMIFGTLATLLPVVILYLMIGKGF
jgi:uncharacterized membrane protein